MTERNLDFDTVRDRRNTRSLKYDAIRRVGMAEDLLSLWVADMDFKTSSFVQDALIHQAEHGIFGYSESNQDYFKAAEGWMRTHYNWEVSERWLVKTPGIVFALAMAVKAYTEEGDSILIQLPVYYPFREVIEDNGRKMVSNTLYLGEDDRYHIDFKDFEKKIVSEKVKLFILCSPHNPVGRVWTREELERLGDICCQHNVTVISDEIHADFVFEGKHHVFAGIKKAFEDISVTCTSPSKTFNLAGLHISNLWIANPALREAFRRQIYAAGYSQLGIMGIVACQAAYEHGETWYQAMHHYVRDNIHYTKEFIRDNIPQIKTLVHEGTYLVWLDCRELGLSSERLDDLILKKARVWLDGGTMFGESGAGFQRINVACPRSILKEALERIQEVIVKEDIEQKLGGKKDE